MPPGISTWIRIQPRSEAFSEPAGQSFPGEYLRACAAEYHGSGCSLFSSSERMLELVGWGQAGPASLVVGLIRAGHESILEVLCNRVCRLPVTSPIVIVG